MIILQIKKYKIQYDINREAAEISASPLDKSYKNESLTGEEILPLSKAFEKQVKTIEDQRIEQFEVSKALKPEENEELELIKKVFSKKKMKMRENEIKNEIYEIKKWEQKIKTKDLNYETKDYLYVTQQYGTTRSFSDNFNTSKTNIDEAEICQSNLLKMQ